MIDQDQSVDQDRQAMEHDREEQLRCFVGAFLDAESAARLAQVLRLPAGLRRVDRTSWHVTVKFLGSIPPASVADVLAAVDALAGHALEVRVRGFIGLPRASYARVVAAELAANAELEAWAEQLSLRFGPQDRDFHPHVTVARSRRPVRFARQELPEPLPLRLEAPALYRSLLDRAGARYERVVLSNGPADPGSSTATTGSPVT